MVKLVRCVPALAATQGGNTAPPDSGGGGGGGGGGGQVAALPAPATAAACRRSLGLRSLLCASHCCVLLQVPDEALE